MAVQPPYFGYTKDSGPTSKTFSQPIVRYSEEELPLRCKIKIDFPVLNYTTRPTLRFKNRPKMRPFFDGFKRFEIVPPNTEGFRRTETNVVFQVSIKHVSVDQAASKELKAPPR